MHLPWTPEENQRLRLLVTKGHSCDEIARRLGRSKCSVHHHCSYLRLRDRRFWPKIEREFVRRHYGKMPTREIARRINRPMRAVYCQARLLGLTKESPRYDRAHDARIAELNAQGYSDTQIADALGYERHTVSRHRKRLGLPSQATGVHAREAIAAGVRRQLDRLGIPRLSDLRRVAWRKLAIERGWPEVINGRGVCHRHVQILDALYEHGPQTKRELAEAIGANWVGAKKTLASNGKGGSYLAELMRAGLVMSLGRIVGGNGQGGNVQLYALALDVDKGATTDAERVQA